jgi:hypothetical protein
MLTSGTITGIAAFYWRRQFPARMGARPNAYYDMLAEMACLIFWLTLVLMGGALLFYRSLKVAGSSSPKEKMGSDDDPGRRGP